MPDSRVSAFTIIPSLTYAPIGSFLRTSRIRNCRSASLRDVCFSQFGPSIFAMLSSLSWFSILSYEYAISRSMRVCSKSYSFSLVSASITRLTSFTSINLSMTIAIAPSESSTLGEIAQLFASILRAPSTTSYSTEGICVSLCFAETNA